MLEELKQVQRGARSAPAPKPAKPAVPTADDVALLISIGNLACRDKSLLTAVIHELLFSVQERNLGLQYRLVIRANALGKFTRIEIEGGLADDVLGGS
jgi:hypothetical protein